VNGINWVTYYDLRFDDSAPEGHLPVGAPGEQLRTGLAAWFNSVQVVWGWGYRGGFSSLVSRLVDCSR
jgi:hypothetical protein